jgi:hypothetical protein
MQQALVIGIGLLYSVIGTSAYAAHYDGPAVDVNFINQKPAKYAECDQYLNDTTARRYAACEFGRDEAERMAVRYGGGNGRVIGFLRGYAWGLQKMAQIYENDATEMVKGAAAVQGMGGYMQSGIDAGVRDGQSRGFSMGNSDAIARFLKIVDTGLEPNSQITIPSINYEGVRDGYVRAVGTAPTTSSIVTNEIAPQVGMIKVYDDWDATYLGEKTPLTFMELWNTNGTYLFEKERWFDRDLAYTTWIQRPIDTRPKYDNLNNPPLIDPTTSNQIDLKQVFSSAFKNSYVYYVNYYFSNEFYKNLDLGQFEGEIVGEQIGKRVAHYKGLVAEFNKKYYESSLASFYNAFEASYTQQFNATFKDYLTHPKLTVEFHSVDGTENDGILQPGETISAVFTVKNLGGVGTALQASLAGDVMDSVSQNFEISRFRSQRYTAQNIAKLDSRLQPRDTARITLLVNGIATSLNELIQRTIEISSAPISRLDTEKGNGVIYFQVNNVSTLRTAGLVSASLYVNNVKTNSQNVGIMEPGAVSDVNLSFTNIDPMILINQSVPMKMIVTMNDFVMDVREITVRSTSPKEDLIGYFNELANDRGFVPSSISREDQTTKVMRQIVEADDRETKGNRSVFEKNIYKREPQTTLIGKILSQMKSSAQTQNARNVYDQLAKELWPHRKNFRRWLGMIKSGKQIRWEKMCKQLFN